MIKVDIAIIGGGFSGTMVADQLLRRAKPGLSLAVAEKEPRLGGRLWGVGPARKGEAWESVAVPELRAQAEEVARRLLTTSRGRTSRRPGRAAARARGRRR